MVELTRGRVRAAKRPRQTRLQTPPAVPRRRDSVGGAIKASLEHALLGLIAEGRAVSGYDLIKTFDQSMAHYWHAHHGQIYPTLERMRRAGLIESRDIIQRGRPNKRLYTITQAGRQMLLRWLESPIEKLKLKHAPLLRCRFLGHLGAARAREQLLVGRDACMPMLEYYRELERLYFGKGQPHQNVNVMFTYFTLRRGIMFLEETIRFSQWAVAEIARNESLFHRESAAPPRDEPVPRRVVRSRAAAE